MTSLADHAATNLVADVCLLTSHVSRIRTASTRADSTTTNSWAPCSMHFWSTRYRPRIAHGDGGVGWHLSRQWPSDHRRPRRAGCRVPRLSNAIHPVVRVLSVTNRDFSAPTGPRIEDMKYTWDQYFAGERELAKLALKTGFAKPQAERLAHLALTKNQMPRVARFLAHQDPHAVRVLADGSARASACSAGPAPPIVLSPSTPTRRAGKRGPTGDFHFIRVAVPPQGGRRRCGLSRPSPWSHRPRAGTPQTGARSSSTR